MFPAPARSFKNISVRKSPRPDIVTEKSAQAFVSYQFRKCRFHGALLSAVFFYYSRFFGVCQEGEDLGTLSQTLLRKLLKKFSKDFQNFNSIGFMY